MDSSTSTLRFVKFGTVALRIKRHRTILCCRNEYKFGEIEQRKDVAFSKPMCLTVWDVSSIPLQTGSSFGPDAK